MEFSNKVVLITGGSSGIGLSAAIKFAQEGAKVAIFARNKERLAYAISEIKSGVIGAFSQVTSCFGHLDILVNNTGTGKSATAEDTSLDLWNEMFEVHCAGYFLVAREAVRTFID